MTRLHGNSKTYTLTKLLGIAPAREATEETKCKLNILNWVGFSRAAPITGLEF
jgi:hypothetical protein